jgi:tetratricopeptide (TPR) repeat protein
VIPPLRTLWPVLGIIAALAAGCQSGNSRGEAFTGLYIHPVERAGPASRLDHLNLEERLGSLIAEHASRIPGVRLVAPLPQERLEELRDAWELYCQEKGRALEILRGDPDVEIGGNVLVSGFRAELRTWVRRDGITKERTLSGEMKSVQQALPILSELSLQILSEAFPKDASVLMKLGITLSQSGLPGRAVPVYRKVLALDPDSAAAHFNLGVAYDRLGDADKADECYRKTVEVRPDYYQALFNLGLNASVQQRSGESEGALHERLGRAEGYFRRVIQINPRFKDAYHELVEILRQLGKLNQALDECRVIFRRFPGDADAYQDAGAIAMETGRYDQAHAFYTKLAELEPLLVSNDFFLGMALEKMGKLDGAAEHYRRFVELAGADKTFERQVAETLDRLRDMQEKRRGK